MNDPKVETSAKLGIGIALGAALGALGAFFFSPKSGPENRQMAKEKLERIKTFIKNKEGEAKAKEIFGEVNERTKELTQKMRVQMDQHIDQMKEAIDQFDSAKYSTIVHEILDNLKGEVDISQERAEKAKKYMLSMIEEKQKKAKQAESAQNHSAEQMSAESSDEPQRG